MKNYVKSIMIYANNFFYQTKIVLGDRLILKTYCRIYLNKIFGGVCTSLEQTNIIKNISDMSQIIPSAFIWQDLNGRILGLNEQALKLIGMQSRNQVIGKTLREFYPRTISEQFGFDFALALKNRQDIKREYTLEDKEVRQERIFLVSTFPLFDSQNMVFGAVSTLTTIENDAAIGDSQH